MAGPRLPKWLNDILVADSVPWYAPKPTLDEIVGRAGGLPRQQSPEDFISMLARREAFARAAAARSADAALTTDANVFGLPVKTIEQGRSLGERNLPGIENLSPEDQIALAQALDKGAILRAMPALQGDPKVTTHRRGVSEMAIPRTTVKPADRLAEITGSDHPVGVTLGLYDDPTMAMVMNTLQNKANYRRLAGRHLDADLPNAPAYRGSPMDWMDEFRAGPAAEALGSDIPELLKQVRQDQIDSRLLTVDELNDAVRQADFDRSMREAADAVAAREAYARQYGGLPPDTVREMDRGVNRQRMREDGTMERLTGDPLQGIGRQRPDDSLIDPPGSGETFGEYQMRTEGKDILKGFALGHVLSYPLMYAAYKMTQPGEQKTSAFPPQGPARHIGEEASLEDIPIAAAAQAKDDDIRDLIAAIPIEAPAMEPIVMPRDEVGIPEPPQEDMVFLEDDTTGAPAADELPPPPTVIDLDAELRKKGLAGVPEWYVRAMNDPAYTLINGRPKREAYIFSPQSKEYAIERQYRMAGMR